MNICGNKHKTNYNEKHKYYATFSSYFIYTFLLCISVLFHFTQSYHIKMIMISIIIIIDIITIAVLRLWEREKAFFNEHTTTTTIMFLYKHITRHHCHPQPPATSSAATKENEHNDIEDDDTGTVRHNFHLVIISIYLIFHLHSAT